MNQKNSISADILNQLKSAGFRAAFLPYHCMAQITETYEGLPAKSGNTPYIQNAINHFRNHQPPDIPFKPLSFLIAAYPGEPAQIILQDNGKGVAVPIPPTYLDDTEQRQKLNNTLESAAQGYHTAHARGMSQKLLAVYSGLGRFGRNNICYIDGLGSFFSLKAFYTDIPCEDVSYQIAFLESCESCDLCRQDCPTGAIGQNSVINAEKCLTMYNENKQPMPEWIPQRAHHTLIGCFRCQEICPQNKPLTVNTNRSLELSDNETRALLFSDSKALPPELTQKLRQFGLNDFILPVVGRNARLAMQNSRIKT